MTNDQKKRIIEVTKQIWDLYADLSLELSNMEAPLGYHTRPFVRWFEQACEPIRMMRDEAESLVTK